MQSHFLSLLLFEPLAGLLILLLIPKESKGAIRLWANLVLFVNFVMSVPLWWMYDRGNANYQLVERADWIPSIGAHYTLGIDGISLLLILLTTLIGFISVLSSWSAIDTRMKEYYAFFLLLQTGMLGVF